MAPNGLLACALVATLVLVGLASPTKPSGRLSQLMARREAAVENAAVEVATPEENSQTRTERGERMSHLSEEQREFMTKQIMQAISEMMNDCPDRDYQGWVDFGRRSAE
ncbi:hypothetical protein DPEC_G00175070 [Dallia pectoralis]|uniref:Uncharacterized protein n=1 Tax=Dallia pectoralis TaxID=75939 RepID=A0ACC2GEB5_DALPE|nr:hypothetical protein DPEC_G00175070 [Dallia pectoralis]